MIGKIWNLNFNNTQLVIKHAMINTIPHFLFHMYLFSLYFSWANAVISLYELWLCAKKCHNKMRKKSNKHTPCNRLTPHVSKDNILNVLLFALILYCKCLDYWTDTRMLLH